MSQQTIFVDHIALGAGPIAFRRNWQDPAFHGQTTPNYKYGSFDEGSCDTCLAGPKRSSFLPDVVQGCGPDDGKVRQLPDSCCARRSHLEGHSTEVELLTERRLTSC